MDPVFRKTVKGQEAIATRAHGLVGRLRSLLILVDGQRPQSALQTLAAGFGDVVQLLSQLEREGFVETAQAAAPADGAVPPAPAAPQAVLTLAQAKSLATRQLTQILGPVSDPLCMRIEAARNRAEFVESIRRAYAVMVEVRGRAQAELFGAVVEANLPPA